MDTLSLWTVAPATVNKMTYDEARQSVDEIKSHVGTARTLLLDLYEREGWSALGYENWRECVIGEFGQSQSYLYYQLQAARVERNISTIVENNDPIPEGQLRPLASLEPEAQIQAWKIATETAPEGKITAAHVQRVVDEIRGKTVTNAAGSYMVGNNGVKKCNTCGNLWAADLDYCPYCHISPEARIAYVSSQKDKPHVSNNSGNNEWYTPKEYIDAAVKVMGWIDLDPASSNKANEIVGARKYYTVLDDGLQFDWVGKVWMNPPYSSEMIGKFCEKYARHCFIGDITEGIVLVNNATETDWFGQLVEVSSAIVFPKRRIKFIDAAGIPTGAPLQGQAILYTGKNAEKFIDVFGSFGWVARV